MLPSRQRHIRVHRQRVSFLFSTRFEFKKFGEEKKSLHWSVNMFAYVKKNWYVFSFAWRSQTVLRCCFIARNVYKDAPNVWLFTWIVYFCQIKIGTDLLHHWWGNVVVVRVRLYLFCRHIWYAMDLLTFEWKTNFIRISHSNRRKCDYNHGFHTSPSSLRIAFFYLISSFVHFSFQFDLIHCVASNELIRRKIEIREKMLIGELKCY